MHICAHLCTIVHICAHLCTFVFVDENQMCTFVHICEISKKIKIKFFNFFSYSFKSGIYRFSLYICIGYDLFWINQCSGWYNCIVFINVWENNANLSDILFKIICQYKMNKFKVKFRKIHIFDHPPSFRITARITWKIRNSIKISRRHYKAVIDK